MIKIKSIKIENFMSICSIDLVIPLGITELTGSNLDSGGSNGTGKSSLLLAIPQCLFNKNPNLGLQRVNNTVTKKPYRIILELIIDEDVYIIDNNRGSNKIIINKNGEVVTARIKESLLYIEELLNLTYNEFIALTFITSDSLKSIFDITSANLLLKLFSLNKIDEYVNTLKIERRMLSRDIASLRVSKPTPKGNVDELNNLIKENKLNSVVIEQNIERMRNSKAAVSTNARIIELQNIQEANRKGICPTCNQVVSKKELNEKELASLLNKRDVNNKEWKSANAQLYAINSTINLLEAKRVAILEVQQEIQVDNTETRKEIQNKIDIINNTLKVISQGTVHQVYLNQFLRVLNTNLLRNMKRNFKIVAKLDNSKITYTVKTDNHIKDIEQLSGGESTTISLIILTSIYATLRQLLGIDINLLILDEAIHMVDEENKEFISTLIKDMNKDIIVVQHKENINPKIFSNTIKVVKHKGLASIKEQNVR